MNKRILYYSIVVGLAGFLFGFDTVVISGANLPLKQLWQTSDWFHGTFIMSMALWGTVIGALFGGIPTNKLGGRTTLYWIGASYLISALGSALAPDPYIFSFFRFLGGLGVGASSIAAPTYISEIASSSNRGKLVAIYQLNIVLGILLAFISNYMLIGVDGTNDWRWMLGVEAIPAAAYMILVLGVPQSPRWLILHKGDEQEALKVLRLTSNEHESIETIRSIREDHDANRGSSPNIFSKKYSRPLLLAFLIAAFNQLSGINFILYYAPEILEKAGLATADSLLSSISIGIVNLVFTMVGLALIDRVGRKKLMYIGSVGYIVSLSMVAFGFYVDADAFFKLTFILLFIASHAVGQGAVIWVFISEIFPNRVRAYGQSWGAGTHWVFAALITLFGAVLINKMEPWQVFALFACLTVLQLIFVSFIMPETKGVSLEALQEQLTNDDQRTESSPDVKFSTTENEI